MVTRDKTYVAIVDDVDSLRRALARLLSAEGYRVETFASGAEFLHSLSDVPRCVVLDINMPGLDGFEVQRRLSRSDSGVAVIMITGEFNEQVKVRAAAAGAIACLQKPVGASQLLSALSEHCLGLTHDLSPQAVPSARG